ncbi:MAG: alpha/beta fold hydrolase [Tatlockia sp.]|nr:alpha/beta fold hydrolase [Tatlockia sp.]
MNLHIERLGKGQPLVFFHGWGFDHRVWLKLAGELENRYQLYLVDLPGFGHSSLMDWGLFKEKLLIELPAFFALAGWSLGGLLAMRLAIEESVRVTHLISISSTPCFIKKSGWPGVDEIVFANILLNLVRDPQNFIAQFIKLQLQGEAYESFQDNYQPSLSGLEAGLDILAKWDLRELLKGFTKPACFVFGRLDAITPRATQSVMQKYFPNFDYVLFDKAAHMPFLSHQEQFITCLDGFFL